MTMKPHEVKNFDQDAAQWDEHPGKLKMAGDAAAAILREVTLTADMDVMDFGCGTGLLGLKLLPQVKSLTGVDSSQGMLAALRNKIKTLGLTNVRAQFLDLASGERPSGRYHLIVSSMTLHHVPDTAALFAEWFDLLYPGGQEAGFADVRATTASVIGKEVAGQSTREYPIFLITATRRAA